MLIMNYTNTFFFSRLRRIRVTNMVSVEKLFKGEKMKTKLILIAIYFVSMSAKADSSVDNPVKTVDNSYQHELICTGVAESGEYQLKVEWKKEFKHPGHPTEVENSFKYELSSLADGSVYSGTYSYGFDRFVLIDETIDQLNFGGQFSMFKRLGYLERDVNFTLDKAVDGSLTLLNFSEKTIETFENPGRFCNPPTRHCGYDADPAPKYELNLNFINSTCELVR
jgi:hypothetical protein